QEGNQVIVVVSARGDTTDELIELAKEITEQPPAREMDMLLSTGEQISIALMAMAIQTLGERAISFTGAQVGIVTDSTHTKARIKSISTARMRQALTDGQIVIVAGFQGIDENYNITTLGRGGSDTTAVALAAVMKHSGGRNQESGVRSQESGIGSQESGVRRQESGDSENSGEPLSLTPDSCLLTPFQDVGCEIYTDVDGVYTTDPRVVPEARKMDYTSYDEMLELASVGAGVMHSRSIEFGKKFDVPIQVRSSFSDVEGTWIVPEAEWMRDVVVCGAALGRDEARVSLNGVPDEPGISHRVFAAMADHHIVVDMIAQNVGLAGKAAIGFTVLGNELPAALQVLRPLAAELGATIEFDEQVSKVSIVGTGMRTHTGVAERMFAALTAENVNMKMITTADIKISVLVSRGDGIKALRAVHQAFGLGAPRPGAGQPGKTGSSQFQRRPSSTIPHKPDRDLAALTQQLASMEDIVVSDVLLTTDQGRITIFGLPDRPGCCSRVFQAVAEAGIVVDMIVQNLAAGRTELSFSVPQADLERAREVTQEVVGVLDPATRVAADAGIARLFVHGVGMRTHTGVARAMFGALAQRGINISMINTSEVRISVVVDRPRGEEALASLKEAFHLP
ncbi:MAG TPA: aspartate kinase, partial [Gemmataceae bacterium]|nr:aspartate kinase [Gemmataceae bacterium]